VKRTVAMLAAHQRRETTASIGFLGVQLEALDRNVRPELKYQGKGAAVVAVVSGSPADEAGIEPGDVIQGVDQTSVSTSDDVSSIVRKIAPGGMATLRVWSNGTQKLVSVRVGAKPDRSGLASRVASVRQVARRSSATPPISERYSTAEIQSTAFVA
jgi:serine protease Do